MSNIPRATRTVNQAAPNADSLTVLANSLFRAEEYGKALEFYESALTIDPHHAPSLRGLARLHEATNDPVSANHYYEILSKSHSSLPDDFIGLARASLALSDEVGAETALKAAASRFPQDPNVQCALGVFFKKRSRLQKAKLHLRKAVELSPQSKSALRALAEVDFEEGNYTEARLTLERLHSLDPADFQTNFRLAFIYFQNGAFVKALPHYRKAVNSNPKSVDAKVGLAKTLEKLGRTDAAIRTYQEILHTKENTPTMEPVVLALANLLNKRGKFKRTIELIEMDSTSNFKNPGLSCALGIALAGEGRYTEAVAAFERALGAPQWGEFADAQIKKLRKLGSFGIDDSF